MKVHVEVDLEDPEIEDLDDFNQDILDCLEIYQFKISNLTTEEKCQ